MGSEWWTGRTREAMEEEWKGERMKQEDKPLFSPRRKDGMSIRCLKFKPATTGTEEEAPLYKQTY